jgi:hypothetical protein
MLMAYRKERENDMSKRMRGEKGDLCYVLARRVKFLLCPKSLGELVRMDVGSESNKH